MLTDLMVRFEFTDPAQNNLDVLQVGQDALLNVYVQDTSLTPLGVRQAFFTLNYDAAQITANDPITHGPNFGLAPLGDTSTPGTIINAGSLDSDAIPPTNPTSEFLLFSVPIAVGAVGDGTLDINTSLSPITALAPMLFGSTDALTLNNIEFVGNSIPIATATINVTPTSGLQTTEGGGTAEFSVVLGRAPTDDVTIGLSSSNPDEGTIVGSTSLRFTPGNWDTPQTVTVRGVNDERADGNVGYSIVTAPAQSGDSAYNGLNAQDVMLTNLDDADSAGIIVNPTGVLNINEGSSQDFTLRLNSEPLQPVQITFDVSNEDEVVLNRGSMTFNANNWDTPRPVTVSALDDRVDDGDIAVNIDLNISTAAPEYMSLNPAPVSVITIDDDTAGITVMPIDSTTDENGDTGTFSVVLESQPTGPVSIPVSSSDETEGRVAIDAITFTTSNWSVAQTVTVTGQPDNLLDGNVTYSIVLGTADSPDPVYRIDPDDVMFTNLDDGLVAGFAVNPLGPLSIGEGDTQNLSIALTSPPTEPVVIVLEPSLAGELTLSQRQLTFSQSNWNTPREITVTANDDAIDDGNITLDLTFDVTTNDPDYAGLTLSPVSVTTLDDDVAGISLNLIDLTTDEDGDTARFTIVLDSQPTSTVTIPISSSDETEGVVAPTMVEFTPTNWESPQEVVVTGQRDNVVDGDIAFDIVLGTTVTSDPLYQVNPTDVSITNLDVVPDSLIAVTPTAGLTTDEGGGQASFSVVLEAQPGSEVTISVASNDTTEGIVSEDELVFTPSNWNTVQTVVVAGQDDNIVDGDIPFAIELGPATSSDPAFNNVALPNVQVVNQDLDVARLVVTGDADLRTSESGTMVTFSLELSTRPTAAVTIPIASNDVGEGTVTPSMVMFTPANWNQPQPITVTGVQDEIDDDDVQYSITLGPTSGAPEYDGAMATVSVTNEDDGDTAGFTIADLSSSVTQEAPGGSPVTFTVVLDSEPVSEVVIPVSSDDSTEGIVDVASITFSPGNWDVPQLVTVSGVNDDVDDMDVAYSIALGSPVSDDPKFTTLAPQNVALTNEDDDTAGIVLSRTGGLVTNEDPQSLMRSDTFTVQLNSEPVAPVSFDISSSDVTEGTVTPAMLQFDATNWDQPQTVTATGVDDVERDGDMGYMVTLSSMSGDALYAGLMESVGVLNIDDDVPGVVFSRTLIETTELGPAEQVLVTLRTPPVADVTFTISSSDETEGTVSPTSLEFTPANWDVAQPLVITPQNDDVADGPISYQILTSSITSADPDYTGLEVLDLTVTNADDDVPGISAVTAGNGTVGENGDSLIYNIRLTSEPLADVDVAISSSDASEAIVSIPELTFTPQNWDVPQQVEVTGLDDAFVDGDIEFDLRLDPSSQDDVYDALATSNFAIQNVDDDNATISIAVNGPTEQTEGMPASELDYVLEVTLTGAVEGGFGLDFLGSDGTATLADQDYQLPMNPLAFSGTDGETQILRPTVLGDNKVEPDEQFSVALGNLLGLSPSAAARIAVDVAPIVLTILNDDTATISISGNVTMPEGTGVQASEFTFEVTLSNPVQGGVSIPYNTTDGTATLADSDYVDNDGMLLFSETGPSTQTINVQVTPDNRVERTETFSVTLGAPVNDTGMPVANVSVTDNGSAMATITNDDFATISFVDPASIVLESAGIHRIPVQLSVSNGGTLSETVVIDVNDLLSGSAVTPADYSIGTPTISFPAASADGTIQDVAISLVLDQILEPVETLQMSLSTTVGGEGTNDIGGAVSVGDQATHQVEIVDDPMTGSISGFVWDDRNEDGVFDANEEGIPDVTIRLTGIDVFQAPVNREIVTDNTGAYRFANLPIGQYEIAEVQPAGFDDGMESRGRVEDDPAGSVDNDRFFDIVLGPAQSGSDFNFGEIAQQRLSKRQFLASVVTTTEVPQEADNPQEDTITTATVITSRFRSLQRLGTSRSGSANQASSVTVSSTQTLGQDTPAQIQSSRTANPTSVVAEAVTTPAAPADHTNSVTQAPPRPATPVMQHDVESRQTVAPPTTSFAEQGVGQLDQQADETAVQVHTADNHKSNAAESLPAQPKEDQPTQPRNRRLAKRRAIAPRAVPSNASAVPPSGAATGNSEEVVKTARRELASGSVDPGESLVPGVAAADNSSVARPSAEEDRETISELIDRLFASDGWS